MLRLDGTTVEFRHELARRAILEALTPSERAALERRALEVLLARPSGVDPSRAAHHAVAAGDADAVLEWAPRAGARAAALGAHREARAHYASALRFSDRLTITDRAGLLEAHAYECYLADDLEEAIAGQEEAIGCWRGAGDPGAEGHALSNLGHFCGWAGQRERARQAATAAVELLEPLPPDVTLAWSYARLAQLHMIAGELVVSVEWGERALSLAQELGEEEVVVHALNTIGVSEYQLGRDEGWSKLEASMRRALAAESEENIARAFNNLISMSREERRYDLVDRYLADTMQFMAEHDLDATRRCLIGDVAEAELDRGRWAEAEAQAKEVLGRDQPSGRLQSAGVLGRLAARRGDGDPSAMLDEFLALATEFNPESAIEARSARAEAAWLAKDNRAGVAEVKAGLALAHSSTTPWVAGKILFWASKLDVPVEGTVASARLAEPYALHFAGHPEKAAVAWATLGCPFDEALALADSDEEADVRRALEIFQSLGAKPAAARATDRLRAMGARGIARGPRQTTLSNPAALTDRELDVLALLGEGLRNVEIAERLVISAKTVDHHVSAILSKLGVRSRYDAGQEAIRLGLASR
jgi:DNA-binding CsgD family transcriptional regulator